MTKLYNLNYENQIFKGIFVNDPDFGFFFFTEKTEVYIRSIKTANLIIDGDVIVDKNGKEYQCNKIKGDKYYVYCFSLKNLDSKPNVISYTLKELDNIEGFDTETILGYLSNILSLPNGNYVCGNVQDFILAIDELTKKYPEKEYFFRGHSSYEYKLIPSLYRNKDYYENEDLMYMDFKTQFYNELSHKKYIEILTTMQHYNMPTRLLDTTSNPLVSLYMTVDKVDNESVEDDLIGEVIVMKENKKNVKYSDSNAVTLLSSLAVLETKYKQELYEKIVESLEKNDPSIYKECLSYKRFVAEVRNELAYFDETFFSPEVLLSPKHVKVGMINERIIAQSGNFILFGLYDYINGNHVELDTVIKERIFVVNKKNILKQLELLNISDSTMYPDKDHTSKAIKKYYGSKI